MDLIIVLFVFLIMILANWLLNRIIIAKTVKKHIIPQLVESGFDFIRIENLGFLNTGDFEDATLTIRPFNPMGTYKMALYRRVIYMDKSKKLCKTTVKIDWNLFRKTEITFNPPLNRKLQVFRSVP